MIIRFPFLAKGGSENPLLKDVNVEEDGEGTTFLLEALVIVSISTVSLLVPDASYYDEGRENSIVVMVVKMMSRCTW